MTNIVFHHRINLKTNNKAKYKTYIKSLYSQVQLKEILTDDTNIKSVFKETKITKNLLKKFLQLCS